MTGGVIEVAVITVDGDWTIKEVGVSASEWSSGGVESRLSGVMWMVVGVDGGGGEDVQVMATDELLSEVNFFMLFSTVEIEYYYIYLEKL